MKAVTKFMVATMLVVLIAIPSYAFADGRHYGGGPYYGGGSHYGGHRHHNNGGTALGLGIIFGAVVLGSAINYALTPPPPRVIILPQQPVYYGSPMPIAVAPQPVYVTPGMVCMGTLTPEYGWVANPYGGPPVWTTTGRLLCS